MRGMLLYAYRHHTDHGRRATASAAALPQSCWRPSYCPARSRCVNPTLFPDTLGCARCRLPGLVRHDGVCILAAPGCPRFSHRGTALVRAWCTRTRGLRCLATPGADVPGGLWGLHPGGAMADEHSRRTTGMGATCYR